MKKLVLYFIVLLISVWVGVLIHNHAGYVLISFNHTTIEMTLWLAILAIILFVFLLYGLIRLLRGTYHLPARYRNWDQKRNRKKYDRLMLQGLGASLMAKWPQAEKIFTKATPKVPQPVLAYLGAAKAAQCQNDYACRNKYLAKARQQTEKSQQLSLDVLQVRWQIKSEEWEAARENITRLERQLPNSPLVLRELSKVYLALHEWDKLQELLPRLQKRQALTPEALEHLQQRVYQVVLTQAKETGNLTAVENVWKKMPSAVQENPVLLSIYIETLFQHGQTEKAEKLLKTALKTSPDKMLLRHYADVVSADPAKQIARAEAWLQQFPDNPDVLYCLGKLCFRHKLWGKARSYLESSLSKEPNPEISLMLGETLEQLNEKATAILCYRKGLQVCSRDVAT